MNPLEGPEARVARGAALLDARAPGWHRHVDMHELDTQDPTRCVLGQLWPGEGGFARGCDELLGVTHRTMDIADHGFASNQHDQAWREAIAERRATDLGRVHPAHLEGVA